MWDLNNENTINNNWNFKAHWLLYRFSNLAQKIERSSLQKASVFYDLFRTRGLPVNCWHLLSDRTLFWSNRLEVLEFLSKWRYIIVLSYIIVYTFLLKILILSKKHPLGVFRVADHEPRIHMRILYQENVVFFETFFWFMVRNQEK